jgi:hypothetical protein
VCTNSGNSLYLSPTPLPTTVIVLIASFIFQNHENCVLIFRL